MLVLDDADRLLDNKDFLNFLQDVLSRAEQFKLIVTAKESFKLRNFQSHEAVRVGALDESSAQKLVPNYYQMRLLLTALTSCKSVRIYLYS